MRAEFQSAIVLWLAAVGALGSAAATLWLALIARNQLRQANDLAEQAVALERSRWAAQFSENFFSPNYRQVRQVIDPFGARNGELQSWVQSENERLTECLNLFEVLAYLESQGQVRMEDVQAIFCYYLAALRDQAALRAYIDNPAKGYERLSALLAKI